MHQQQLALPQEERQVSRRSLFMLVLSSTYVCTTCLNDLDPSFISLFLCVHYPFHNMVCSRTSLVVSPYAQPKHARLSLKNFPSMHRLRAILLSLNARVHHLAAWPESLGVIAWLLHCCSLAFCAQGMAGARPRLIVAMSTWACVMHAVLELFVHDSLW